MTASHLKDSRMTGETKRLVVESKVKRGNGFSMLGILQSHISLDFWMVWIENITVLKRGTHRGIPILLKAHSN